MNPPSAGLLTDPFLQRPTVHSVNVVWFTAFQGERHLVNYGPNLEQVVLATSTQLSHTQEDQQSRVGLQTQDAQLYSQPTPRPIWRHEATVAVEPGQRVNYRVSSQPAGQNVIQSDIFTLASLPAAGTPLKILLTSDHQLMPMVAANLQKVEETIGQVDAVFLAGDLVNVADRASEWFDDNRGGAFFPCLQGRAHYDLDRAGCITRYRGGQLIQTAPLFPAIGNHEVMGRRTSTSLNEQFNDAVPRAVAAQRYQPKTPASSQIKSRTDWIKAQSFNTDTYTEIFSLPEGQSGDHRYYAITFGDIRLVVLYITQIWRPPQQTPETQGRYQEREQDLERPENWGYGQHVFEPIDRQSAQYCWLEAELSSPAFQGAPYRIVMFHHPLHTQGDNIVPAFTDPVQNIVRDQTDRIQSVQYEYPQAQNYLIRDLEPLLDQAGVQLIFYGHSHLWNRFMSASGMHYLESSNVGNTYGAYLGNHCRKVPVGYRETYAATGDPNGLEPIVPTIAPFKDENQTVLPYIASNDISVFSILDTKSGTVSSYAFDTRLPGSDAFKFDEFSLSSPSLLKSCLTP
jgi:Calcineurin-like phosphoesterase